jgi:hypothetical protein
MKKTFCDRCKKEILNIPYRVKISELTQKDNHLEPVAESDLCDVCLGAFGRFMRGEQELREYLTSNQRTALITLLQSWQKTPGSQIVNEYTDALKKILKRLVE